MYLKGQKLEVTRHSLHREYKNVQKSALTNVNIQRTGKSILQMFAFSFFDGSHICRFLPILRPSYVPWSHFGYPKTNAFILINNNLYLQILHFASESRFCVGKQVQFTPLLYIKRSKLNHIKQTNKLEFTLSSLRPKIAQLLKKIRDVGISIISQPQPHHNQTLVRIHIEYLATNAHRIIAGVLWLISTYTTGIVPAEMVSFIIP